MIRQRVPVNLFNYRPTLLGLEIWRMLSIFILAVLSFLLYRITGNSASFLAMAPILMIAIRYHNITVLESVIGWASYALGHKTVERRFTIYSLRNGEVTVLRWGNRVFTVSAIRGTHLLETRNREQYRIYSSLEKVMNDIELRVTFFTASFTCREKDRGKCQQTIRNFVIVQDRGSPENRSDDRIVSLTERMRGGLGSVGFSIGDVELPELQDILAEIGYRGSENILGSDSGDVSKAEIVSVTKRYRHYRKTSRYYADLVLKDSSYELGPSYVEILLSMGIDFTVSLSFKNIDAASSSEYLKRITSERSAEMRSAGSSFTNSGNRLRLQVQDGKHMLDLLGSNNILPTIANLTLTISADHPVILRENISRAATALRKVGMDFLQVSAAGRMKDSAVPFVAASGMDYLMNTRSVSSILPFLSADSSQNYGIKLGYDDLNEQPIYLDFFSGSSHNSIILGETGSGKSFFAKHIISRYLEARNDLSIIIFDPLEEYDCSSFNAECSVAEAKDMNDTASLAGNMFLALENRDESHKHSRIIIVRPGKVADESWDGRLQGILSAIMNTSGVIPGNKIVILDECHLFLKSNENKNILDSLVRHSRHSGTAVMSISQNVTDFMARESRSIIYNSANIFLFRTRSLTDSYVEALKLDDFDTEAPETLVGGKGHSYSECIYSDGYLARKLRIVPEDGENYPT